MHDSEPKKGEKKQSTQMKHESVLKVETEVLIAAWKEQALATN